MKVKTIICQINWIFKLRRLQEANEEVIGCVAVHLDTLISTPQALHFKH